LNEKGTGLSISKNLHMFISPHLDDVALSCGGYLSRLADAGKQVIIVTVATEDVPENFSLSPMMKWRHIIWRQGNSPFLVRRCEDISAASILGVQFEHFDMLDAIYRCDRFDNPLYPEKITKVPIQALDRVDFLPILCTKLKKILSTWAGEQIQVYCPLGIGEHIDHIIVRSAVEEVFESQKIIYYEDYPYIAKLSSIQHPNEPSNTFENWKTIIVKLSSGEIEARIAAVASYASQIPILFPSKIQHVQNRISFHLLKINLSINWPMSSKSSRQRIASSLTSYISRVGGERYWFRNSKQNPEIKLIGINNEK